jgi:hypothetical protein
MDIKSSLEALTYKAHPVNNEPHYSRMLQNNTSPVRIILLHSHAGFHIKQAYPDKYIVIANTFTKGTYHVLFLGYSEGLKNEFQNITVNVKDPFYKGTHPIFYDSPPVNYLWSGDGTGDLRDPMKHFVRNSSNGFDAILFINNEEPLKPYKTNNVFS